MTPTTLSRVLNDLADCDPERLLRHLQVNQDESVLWASGHRIAHRSTLDCTQVQAHGLPRHRGWHVISIKQKENVMNDLEIIDLGDATVETKELPAAQKIDNQQEQSVFGVEL